MLMLISIICNVWTDVELAFGKYGIGSLSYLGAATFHGISALAALVLIGLAIRAKRKEKK
ncbi:MAG: hypothetical protein P9M03_00620 [Candidatus Theseobacter exili]|nr:hypothetical protein [Candidatus Theseobacter exili]